MAEYHEALWVVVGTAAPLIALTYAVSVASAFRSAVAAVGIVRRSPENPEEQEPSTEDFHERAKAAWKLFEWPYTLAALGFVMNLVALVVALIALALRRDTTVLVVLGISLTVLPFALLPVQALVSAKAEAWAPEIREGIKPPRLRSARTRA